MSSIRSVLAAEHRVCDELFADLEEAIAGNRWEEAEQYRSRFVAAMERHFGKEEEILFPAFEERTGMQAGPTQVMRGEHEQMRGLFQRMPDQIAAHNTEQCLGLSETLLVLMQQHNLKEEQMLYPMADEALAGRQAEILARLRSAPADIE